MFKTINISGFVSFLLYTFIVGFFAGLGWLGANFCCMKYDPAENAKGIVEELTKVASN
jgi:hypothetical protein